MRARTCEYHPPRSPSSPHPAHLDGGPEDDGVAAVRRLGVRHHLPRVSRVGAVVDAEGALLRLHDVQLPRRPELLHLKHTPRGDNVLYISTE